MVLMFSLLSLGMFCIGIVKNAWFCMSVWCLVCLVFAGFVMMVWCLHAPDLGPGNGGYGSFAVGEMKVESGMFAALIDSIFICQ